MKFIKKAAAILVVIALLCVIVPFAVVGAACQIAYESFVEGGEVLKEKIGDVVVHAFY